MSLSEEKLNKIFDNIWYFETLDRSKGSFKRALWYGNKSPVFGQNKGLRKLIRNAPRKAITFAIGKVPTFGDALSFVAERPLDLAKNIYAKTLKHKLFGKPQTAEEQYRKNVKHEVKALKSNAVGVIDRNLVKMRDARAKVKPALDEYMGATSDNRFEKGHKLVRAIQESYYYEIKIMGLNSKLREATIRIDEDLQKLNDATIKTYGEVCDHMLEFLADE